MATSTDVSSPTGTEPVPGGRLFVWNPFYGYIDSLQGYALITGIKGNLPKEKNPSRAVSLGFSPYSDQIAYLLENRNGYLELWISDLMLTHPQQIWVDQNNELGYINKSIDQVFEIKWNLDDTSVLISRYPTINSDAEAGFLFSVPDNQLLKPLSTSGYLLTSPVTGNPALAFEMSDGFVVLEPDGPVHEVQSLPANKIPVLDAVFSPDKQKALYISGEKVYLKSNADIMDLNIGYVPVWHDRYQVILQWSQTGNRVLVYGIDLSGKYCLAEQFGSQPCWQVINALTGEHLWWESKPTNAVAAISPDGKQVAQAMYVPGNPSIFVSDVDTKNNEFISDNAVSALHWSGK